MPDKGDALSPVLQHAKALEMAGGTHSGAPTGPDAIYALAIRVGTLAEQVKDLKEGGERRDDKLDTLTQEVGGLVQAVNRMTLVQAGQLSPEQLETVRAILKGYDHTIWLRARIKYWFFGIGATIAVIYTLRDFIKWIISLVFPGTGPIK